MKKLHLVPTIILAGGLLLCSTPLAQAQVDPFGSALDGAGLEYTTGGPAEWFVLTTTTHDGVDAARSGQIGDGGESYIQTTITGPDRIRFWWKVSSESNYDYLSFLVDYNLIQTISGEVDWEQVIYDIPPGSHTITWNYTKDVSIATGSDAGFLDEVRLASQTNEPIITSPLTVTGAPSEFFSYQISATLNPQTFTATPLPAGLSLNSSGLLSGFPTDSGTTEVNISAVGPAGTANAILTIYIVEPTITSPTFVTAMRGEFFSYKITATHNVQSFTATPLPAWLSLNTSGLLSGFPTGSGTIDVNISAIGPATTANAILTIYILEPTITSPLYVTATRDEFFSYQITATGNPQTFAATPRPAWLSLNASGLLSGLPTGSGTIEVNISATGAAGTAAAILTITILEPFITSPLFVTATRGELFSYQITATGNPQNFMATPLPAWLSLNASGLLSGFPSGSGTINVNISATGAAGTATGILAITILEPFITSPLFVTATRGELFSYQITATGNPQNFTATPRPAWLSLNASGLLSGFPSGSGTINVNISAAGAAGTATGILAITILEPFITSPLAATAMQDELFSYQITATGNPQTFTATPRPGWLSLNSGGLLSGFPPGSGTINLNISATGPAGTATAILVIAVAPPPANLATAADGVGLAWRHAAPSNGFWFNQSDVTHDGVDAAQSGAIGHGQSSLFQIQVAGPGTLSFWWRVSSESCCDPLAYALNGVWVAGIRGETGWAGQTLAIPEGSNTVVFSYSKDGSVVTGSDAGWIDEIAFAPLDSDNDGLADSWEQTFFRSLDQQAEADADSDGFSNLNEYRFDTEPNSLASNTGIIASVRNPDNSVTLEWPAVPGRIYGIEWSTNLINWIPLSDKVSTAGPLMRAVVAPVATTVTLVSAGAPAFALGPASDIGTNWRGGNEPGFVAEGGHTGWLTGQQGIGYENDFVPSGGNIPYTPFIGLDVKSQTFDANPRRSSVYVRIPFTVGDPSQFSSLRLSVRFDDGFASWINGRSLTNENAPVSPAWNATTSTREDSLAAVYKDYDVTARLPGLFPGTNILALQGVNRDATSSDLLVQAILTATIPLPPAASQRVFWRITSQ